MNVQVKFGVSTGIVLKITVEPIFGYETANYYNYKTFSLGLPFFYKVSQSFTKMPRWATRK